MAEHEEFDDGKVPIPPVQALIWFCYVAQQIRCQLGERLRARRSSGLTHATTRTQPGGGLQRARRSGFLRGRPRGFGTPAR